MEKYLETLQRKYQACRDAQTVGRLARNVYEYIDYVLSTEQLRTIIELELYPEYKKYRTEINKLERNNQHIERVAQLQRKIETEEWGRFARLHELFLIWGSDLMDENEFASHYEKTFIPYVQYAGKDSKNCGDYSDTLRKLYYQTCKQDIKDNGKQELVGLLFGRNPDIAYSKNLAHKNAYKGSAPFIDDVHELLGGEVDPIDSASLYVSKIDDDYYEEGVLIKTKKGSEYRLAFDIVFDMTKRGQVVCTYETFEREFKKRHLGQYRKRKKLEESGEKSIRDWAQDNLTVKSKGMLSKVSRPDFITTVEGKGFKLNNKK